MVFTKGTLRKLKCCFSFNCKAKKREHMYQALSTKTLVRTALLILVREDYKTNSAIKDRVAIK